MDWNLVYWCGVWSVTAAAMAQACWGWSRARAGHWEAHRRAMHRAIFLVGLFLASYPFKLALLGREHLGSWSSRDLTVLRVHEVFVLSMLAFGARTRWLARGFEGSPSQVGKSHRLWGRAAIVAGLFGLLTATLVLSGMFERSRLPGEPVAAQVSEAD